MSGFSPTLLVISVKQQDASASLDTLTTKMNADGLVLEISLYCGRDFDKFGVLLAEIHSLLQVVLESLYRTLNLLSCERVVTIYHSSIYDAACRYSVEGVMWVFASSLIMATFGLIMILFRSGYKPTRYMLVGGHDESSSRSESWKDEGKNTIRA